VEVDWRKLKYAARPHSTRKNFILPDSCSATRCTGTVCEPKCVCLCSILVNQTRFDSIRLDNVKCTRSLTRPRCRSEDIMKIYLTETCSLGMDWIHFAQDRGQRRAAVNTVMYTHKMCGISSSSRTLHLPTRNYPSTNLIKIFEVDVRDSYSTNEFIDK
jgi:hypothetical protein